jgi:hypothetical protein
MARKTRVPVPERALVQYALRLRAPAWLRVIGRMGKRIDHGGCGPQCDTKSAVAAWGTGVGKANRSRRHET